MTGKKKLKYRTSAGLVEFRSSFLFTFTLFLFNIFSSVSVFVPQFDCRLSFCSKKSEHIALFSYYPNRGG